MARRVNSYHHVTHIDCAAPDNRYLLRAELKRTAIGHISILRP